MYRKTSASERIAQTLKSFIRIHLWAHEEQLRSRHHLFFLKTAFSPWGCDDYAVDNQPEQLPSLHHTSECHAEGFRRCRNIASSRLMEAWVKLKISHSDVFKLIYIYLGKKVWQPCGGSGVHLHARVFLHCCRQQTSFITVKMPNMLSTPPCLLLWHHAHTCFTNIKLKILQCSARIKYGDMCVGMFTLMSGLFTLILLHFLSIGSKLSSGINVDFHLLWHTFTNFTVLAAVSLTLESPKQLSGLIFQTSSLATLDSDTMN